ncbi:MAG: hypothetical protein ACREM8_06560 [Vulcanimicrobiaceae bacterium]
MKLFRLAWAARRHVPQVLPHFRDPRVPLWLKLAAGLLAILVVCPLDLLSDIPVLGLLDDGILLMLLVHGFVTLAERAVARWEPPLVRVRPDEPAAGTTLALP